MDKSFNSSFLKLGSPRMRQQKKTLPSSFRKSSNFSISAKSTQSLQIILSTPYNYVERFGQPLPVLITEALTFADRNTVVSARISKQGYAWVVCGRRLLIWQYRQSPTQKKSGNQCFELLLPQSDLAHRTELVWVLAKVNTISCIAVSPEGLVRYWPAIVHEGVSIEQSIDLQGQECDNLTDLEGLGCILATTTCTIVLIQPQLLNGRHSLKCKPLKTPTGWLGGLSKKMSSLIFGPNTNEHNTETRLVRVVGECNVDSWTVYVLVGHSLQKWKLLQQETEELIFMVELNRMIRDQFRSVLWENCITTDQTLEIDVWLLDFQIDKSDIIILAAAVNVPVSPRIHYALICFQTDTQTIKDFLLLKLTNLYQENVNDSLAYRFLLCGTWAYLYNHKAITVIKPHEEPDTLEFTSAQDYLLAGEICVNTPIFFSKNYGLVAISSNELSTDLNCSNTPVVDASFINDNVVVNNLSIYNMDPEEIVDAYKDTTSQLKAAFIFHIKKQETAYKEIINEIFPAESVKLPGIDSLLDKVVVMMCTDLLDDIPAGDPRWNNQVPVGIGSSYTMQVLHQLEDKQRAHLLFMQFLRDSGLWSRLGASTVRNTTIATIYYLAELSERIFAAILLKSLPHSEIMEKCIETVVKETGIEPENGLTFQDIFYRRVSQVHKIIQQIVNYCEEISHSNTNPVEIVKESNDIILTVLQQVLKHRQQSSQFYTISETVSGIAPDYLPWTAASGAEGLLDSLIQLHYLSWNYGVKFANTEHEKTVLITFFVDLVDIILDGRKSHVESIKSTNRGEIAYKQYSKDKQKFLKPLVEEKQWSKAAQLAEKYLDFETLVVICEGTNNQSRLDDYIDRFEGFSDYAYNWFLKENKQARLIEKFRTSKNVQKLNSFLADHPSLSWIQNIIDKKYNLAANTLKQLGSNETESITRQKTMFSLSKLAELASVQTNKSAINEINSQLEIIAFQEEIPDYVLQEFGYDDMRVIPVKELINLYICEEYKEASEMEFKKALDLLQFIENDDELKQKLSLKIWTNAILRDSWTHHTNLDSPLDILQSKLFFRLIDLIMALDGNCLNFLPALDTIVEEDSLKELKDDKNFQFLLKTGYEHVYKTQMAE